MICLKLYNKPAMEPGLGYALFNDENLMALDLQSYSNIFSRTDEFIWFHFLQFLMISFSMLQ